jgi:PAS domain S-box-containing protein
MYRSDASGRVLSANPAIVVMLGYDSVEEVLALDLNRDVYADPTGRAPILEHYRDGGLVDGVVALWKSRTGREFSVQLFGHVVEGASGLTFDATVIDLTDFEESQRDVRRLRDDHERATTTLALLMRQMPIVTWIVDRDLRLLSTGGAVESLLGFPPNQYVGKTLFVSHAENPGSADPIAHHRRALAGEVAHYLTEYQSKQLVNTIGPYRDADGNIIGAIGTAIDVTSSHQLERRMVDAQRAESLGVLAGGLAHDFNNLLVAILGNTDLALREIPPGASGRFALENIRNAGLRAAELIEQLLAYAGGRGVSTTRVSPASIIDELLRISAPSIPNRVSVAVDISRDLTIRGDAAQVRQVLFNLFANARQAIGEHAGTIAITGRLIRHDGIADPDDIVSAAAGTYALMEIKDDGPGMDRETRRRIFEPFFTTKSNGHGLGLAAVIGIVRAHGGGLRTTATPGEGARFVVLWPTSVTPAEMQAVSEPASRTVLVIDDEDLVRDVVARMIEDLGYAAVTAADGAAGLAVIDRQAIDAVLVDLSMPAMSGTDVLARLRERRPAIPVVVCSGFDRDGRGPIQADAYLPKPFRIEALEKTLAKILPRP